MIWQWRRRFAAYAVHGYSEKYGMLYFGISCGLYLLFEPYAAQCILKSSLHGIRFPVPLLTLRTVKISSGRPKAALDGQKLLWQGLEATLARLRSRSGHWHESRGLYFLFMPHNVFSKVHSTALGSLWTLGKFCSELAEKCVRTVFTLWKQGVTHRHQKVTCALKRKVIFLSMSVTLDLLNI